MAGMPLGSVDLIYLDPPFNSSRDYNAIYKDETGRPLPDQIEAFSDTWTLDAESERTIRVMPALMREAGLDDDVAEFWRLWMNALRNTNPSLLAYLSYMVQRLLPMRGLLKPTGCLFLHCDTTASHYIKIMLDAIFGHKNFRNEIVWCYKTRPQSKRYFGKKHDSILFYSKGDRYKFNPDDAMRPLTDASIAKYKLIDSAGRKYRLNGRGITGSPIKSAKDVEQRWEVERPDLVVRDYLDERRGVVLEDWWVDINIINQSARERMGYATQKPVALLERIIKAATDEGDVVFDPFCGCATTIEAAHKLGRKWIGIDIAIHAIKRVAGARLRDRMGLVEGVDYMIEGVPQNMEGAQDLWQRDKYHFQKWAVESVDGFVTSRRTADGGIDGRLYFTQADTDNELSSMIIEVKGGANVSIDVVRSLRGVLEREDYSVKLAGLIIMEPLSNRKLTNFKREMALAGMLDVFGVQYPVMQILTVTEILEGKRFMTPSRVLARGQVQPTLPSSQEQVLQTGYNND